MIAFGNKEHTESRKSRLGLIECLHMQQCSLRGGIPLTPPPPHTHTHPAPNTHTLSAGLRGVRFSK